MLETLHATPSIGPDLLQVARAGPVQPISLNFLVDVLRRRWMSLMLSIALMLGLGAAFAFLTPKKYAATATLLIDTKLAQLSQSEAGSSVVDQAAVESQIELLRSEKMLTTVIDKLKLLKDPEFGSALDHGGDRTPPTPEVALRRAVAGMAENLWVSRVGRSYLVSVAYNSPDPVKAARIANEVAGAYIADQIEAKVQAAQDQNAWLDAQVSERRARAAQAYRNVQDFKGSHDINPLRDLDMQQEIDRLSGDASRARAATVTARADLDRTTALLSGLSPGTPLPVAAVRALQDAALDTLVGREGDVLHPPLAAGNGQAPPSAAADADQHDLPGRVRQRLMELDAQHRATWLSATGKQRAVDEALADVRLRDTRSRLIQERLRELETEGASSRSLYESYLNQLTHAAQQQPVPASDTRVISPATVPLYPSTPKKKLVFLLAGIAGTMLGLVAVFALESLDIVIRTRDRLVAVTELPCLGVVPYTRWRRQRRARSPLDRLGGAFPRLTEAGPRSKASDLLRRLAAASGSGAPGAPVLGVTSAVAREGKSTLALNLALFTRRPGRRVLLIDANLRTPRLSELVLPDGLSTVPELSLRQAIAVDDDLDILPASAQGTFAGAEVPDLRLFEAALVEARARYDLVIVDLPAILPVSEVQAVLPSIDLVALVTRWGSTTSIQVERALGRLSESDCLFGVVLNSVRTRTMRRFEGSSYPSFADQTLL